MEQKVKKKTNGKDYDKELRMVTSGKQKLKQTTLKTISAILYFLVTTAVAVLFISAMTEGKGLSYAVFLIVLLSYGSIAFTTCLIHPVVGLFVVLSNRKGYQVKGTLKFFVVFLVLPVLTFLLFLLLTILTKRV